MNKDYESEYHHSEEANWWFVARRDMIKKFLKKFHIQHASSILDIGCAGGTLALELQKEGFNNISVLDYSQEAIELCKERGLTRAYQMDGHNPEFAENTFDLIIASDSLEHLEFDEIALNNWYRILKPGGAAIIFVPAFMFLWTKHDEINYHFRRYTSNNLSAKAKASGFRIARKGYWNFLLFFPISIIRLISRLISKKRKNTANDGDIVALPALLNKCLILLLKLENWACAAIGLPIGISTFIIVRK